MTNQSLSKITAEPKNKPHLYASASDPGQAFLPPSVMNEADDGFQIALNLFGSNKSSLRIFLSLDNRRLHVVGKKDYDGSVANFLWIFTLPENVEAGEITVDRNQDVYLINIPKKTFWVRLKDNLHIRDNRRAGCAS